jgi:hypothetical protein
MSSRREKSFACTLVTGADERTIYVRAWNASSAGEALLEALATSGIREPGTIVVRDAKGRDAWHCVYDPAALGLADSEGNRA